jgi:predicted dehydrogenase
MSQRIIKFGVIGCGLMGREFASAAARWCHLLDLDYAPRIVAACDNNPVAVGWFQRNLPELKMTTSDYHELLALEEVEAVYIAIPHDQHQQVYIDAIHAGKHLLGEKPFGIDQAANQVILEAAAQNSQVLVRCSSQFPFFPGAYRIAQWARENRFGRIIEV